MKLDRLLSILVVLLRRERVQARELAAMFEVSVRTILRDVEAINLAGVPVVTQQGANGGISIAEGYRLDRTILTSDDMAAIISALKGVAGSIPGGRHDVLMDKIRNTLSAQQADMLNSKANRLVIDLSPWGGGEKVKERIAVIRRAIEEYREISFEYTDSNGLQTRRSVEPYSLVLKGRNWYLYAFCLMREGFRLFKVSRMKESEILKNSFEPREVPPEQLNLEHGWPVPDKMVEVVLVFEAELAGLVEEWFQGEPAILEDGRVRVTVTMPENNWLYGLILSFGTGVEVIGPSQVRDRIAEIAEGICRKYKSSLIKQY